jgi:rRNA processing protein Gar1
MEMSIVREEQVKFYDMLIILTQNVIGVLDPILGPLAREYPNSVLVVHHESVT